MDTQVASSLKKEKKKEWFLNFHEKHLVVLQNKSHFKKTKTNSALVQIASFHIGSC